MCFVGPQMIIEDQDFGSNSPCNLEDTDSKITVSVHFFVTSRLTNGAA